MNNKVKTGIIILLLCFASAALGGGIALYWMQHAPAEIPQISQEPVIEEDGDEAYSADSDFNMLEGNPAVDKISNSSDTVGALYVSDARKEYESGSMRLIIPKLELDEAILDGVSPKELAAGDGLYPYAQLPSETDANVSIAGHRNGVRNGKPVPSRKFYYLNTLTEGDYIYLTYDGKVYQYLWECTEVILSDNWNPIRNRGYDCVTLTTCTPIGVADHRLVVRGTLVDSFALTDNVQLEASRTAY